MTWRLTTIVSGAAPGADRGALEAGIELGLRVQGWHTELEVRDAPAAYRENAKPTLSPRMRARLNVQDSDGTLILSVAPAVPSHALYADEACEQQRKASLHVVLPAGGRSTILDDVRKGVIDWLREEKIHVLHVTGPTEREEPGVQAAVKDALVWILEDEIERPVERRLGGGMAVPARSTAPDAFGATSCACGHDRLDHDMWGSGPCTSCECQRFAEDRLSRRAQIEQIIDENAALTPFVTLIDCPCGCGLRTTGTKRCGGCDRDTSLAHWDGLHDSCGDCADRIGG